MFGFLKKKLKDAVKKFTRKAKEEVVEERVEDQEAIERAKQEERRILKKAEVKEIPDTPKEKAQHEKEKAAAKEALAKNEKPAPKRAVSPKNKPAPAKPKHTPEPIPKKPKSKQTPEPEAKPEPKVIPKEAEVFEPIKEEEPVPETKSGFLKKLFKKKEPVPEPVKPPEPLEPVPEPKGLISKPAPEPEKAIPEKKEEAAPEEPVLEEEEKPERGLFAKLKDTFTKKSLSPEKFDEMFWDLEVVLLENNVAVEVIEKLKEDLKRDLTSGKVSRLGIEDLILVSLRKSIEEILDIEGFDLVKTIKKEKKRPYVIAFIGVNGSGKTTTLAKIANLFQEEGLSVVMAASDTFRAAAIDQLQEHANNLAIKLVSQGYGADPAAVAYDAVEHAKAKQLDVVMIDTAGRLHSNANLMAELEKVVRVAKPDLKIFIGESITGNDCVEQAKEFDKLVGIDAIILSKADVDEKGGAALSVSYVTGKPILYLGVGQSYGDLKPFDKGEIVRNLGLDS